MYLLLCTVVCAVTVSAQMCQNYGKECFDHSNCCGGCCRNNICVESTRLCTTPIDDCRTFYCPPGFSCSLYQALGCPGCAIVPHCRLAQRYQGKDLMRAWFGHDRQFTTRKKLC